MREHEAMFNPRSVSWVEPPAAAYASSAAAPAASVRPESEFHFIRAGRVGDGKEAFSTPQRKAAMAAMAARTFPAPGGLPEHIVQLLP